MMEINLGDAVLGSFVTALLGLLGLLWKTSRETKTADRSTDTDAATERLRIVHDATLKLVDYAQGRADRLAEENDRLGEKIDRIKEEFDEAIAHLRDLIEAYTVDALTEEQEAAVSRAAQFLRKTGRNQ